VGTRLMPYCYLLSTIAQSESADAAQPLIDQGSEDLIYVGLAVMAIVLILAVGAISQNIEKAILFAALVTVGLMLAIFVL
jgi:vacuolar-type H+-ATPase subunit I/STV1